ncbi:MAG: hypothetical protein JSW64_02310 [Candidatus Zixiibacteriota bacterium]|nr:MAG: hypothetical protein JSW64_02310 [candidate division Zixibacteria bacterium]
MIWGYALGYAYAILACILFMRFNISLLILSCGSAALTAIYFIPNRSKSRNYSAGLLSFVCERRWELIFAMVAIVLTVIVVARAGRLDGQVHIFPTMFVYDYFNHVSVTAELAKNVPPTNIYYHGLTAHYYWFFHVVPASFYRLVHLQLSVWNLVLMQNCINVLMLFLTLGQLLRLSGVSRRAVVSALSLTLFFYSYVDIFIIGRVIGNMMKITEMIPHLGPVWQKLEGFSGLSHGYLRDFWVEPHAAAAILFIATTVQIQCAGQIRIPPLVRGIILGALVFVAFGCDSFLGTILALWVGLDNIISFLKGDRAARLSILRLAGGIALAAGFSLFYIFGLNMIGSQKELLTLTPMTGIIAILPFYLMLDYGPIFLFGITGWWISIKKRISSPVGRIWLLGLVALVIGLLLRHIVEINVILRKAGKPLQLVLLVGAAFLFERVLHANRRTQVIVVIALLIALPTVGLDIQAFGGFAGSRGMENYIGSNEMRALRWIKENTPPNSIVQGRHGYDPEYEYEFNPVPPLAERPVAVGTYMMAALWGVGGNAAVERLHVIDTLFQTASLNKVTAIVDSFDIDYLFIGPREQETYQLHPECLWENRLMFETVYDHDSVKVLRYLGRSGEHND